MQQSEETAGETILEEMVPEDSNNDELIEDYVEYVQMVSRLSMLDSFQENLESSYKNSLREIEIQRHSIKSELRGICPHRSVSAREFGDAHTREEYTALICNDCGKWLDEDEQLTYEQQMILDELTSIDQDLGRYDE